MPRTHLPYPPEFRRQMVELARSGCAIWEFTREFECTRRSTMASARVGLPISACHFSTGSWLVADSQGHPMLVHLQGAGAS